MSFSSRYVEKFINLWYNELSCKCNHISPEARCVNYLKGDKLIKVLIDKDCRIKRDIVPTDIDYHVRKPSAREYDDCCNEWTNA